LLSLHKEWKSIILLALLYYTTGELSFLLLFGENLINLGLFLPEGIALAFALYYGKAVVPGVFIGQFILALSNHISVDAALGVSIVNSLEALLAIKLAKKLSLDLRLVHVADVTKLMLMIIFVLQPFSALGGNLILFFLQVDSSYNFFQSLFSWWFGNVMGQMLMTPFVLLLLQEYKKVSLQKFFLYGFVFFALEYFLELIVVINNSFLLLSLTLPLLVYVIFKEGLVYGLFFNLITALVSSYAVYLGIGAFQSSSEIDNVINYNLFILAHITISLTAGILQEEKKEYQRYLEERVVSEIKKNRQQQLFLLQQSRLAQMGEVISMIAHQWRQPLNNLSLINQFLLSKYDKGELDDESVDYFRINSHNQIAMMSQTVDDFQNFFKSDKPKELFCIDDVIRNLIKMTGAIFETHNITLLYKSSSTKKVYGHANEFVQAILNIVNNAKDVIIDREIEKGEITIRLEEERGHLVLRIEDNAGGIDDAILEKIFDPYFSTKQAKNGTGLGLYMSKMIIEEQMGATLRVFNTQKGASFVITI